MEFTEKTKVTWCQSYKTQNTVKLKKLWLFLNNFDSLIKRKTAHQNVTNAKGFDSKILLLIVSSAIHDQLSFANWNSSGLFKHGANFATIAWKGFIKC